MVGFGRLRAMSCGVIQGNGRDNVDSDEAAPLEGNTWDSPTHLSLEEARINEQRKREAWSEDERRFELTRKHRRCSTFSGAIHEAHSARVTPQGSGYGEAGGTTDSGARLSRGRGRSLTAPSTNTSIQLPVNTDRVSSTRLSSSDSSRFPPGAHSAPRTASPLALVGTSRDHVGYGGPSTAQGEQASRRETFSPTLQRVPSQSVPDLPLRSASDILTHGGQGRTRASSVSGEELPKQYLPGHRRGGSYDINKSLPSPPSIRADPKLWPFSTPPDKLLPCLAVPIPKPLLLTTLQRHSFTALNPEVRPACPLFQAALSSKWSVFLRRFPSPYRHLKLRRPHTIIVEEPVAIRATHHQD
ncbi:hypothetical protein POSPLADRAFT_1043838 [Postia placenta MAD-698-R-SB12]|uniref:Uncharacterized protein n=1 Tax=Postia placenta MAD-698-R-SB12 TaxID=670580 RepID=A0A1X6NCZ7_9APHY|nr:hypothetical protein POSPLADRAFT_1043838 [Postia placenta MAD-698-R-SB12]OSX66400.1 hypothetical protein POSPLADRAFT_1043838 [Postia placenta MAD-698-R-SB12]